MSNPSGVDSEISIHLQRLRILSKVKEGMEPQIKPEDLAKECEAVIEYDDKAIIIIAQLENILYNIHN